MTAIVIAAVAAITIVLVVRAILSGRAAPLAADPAGPTVLEERFEVEPLSDKRTSYACGHDGWKSFRMNLWGERMEMNERMVSERKLCPECILEETRKVSIRCVLCGFIIFPGQPVACYDGGRGMRKDLATRTPHGSYIGCLRMGCCPSGGFFAGHWDGEKFVSAFVSGGSAAAEAFATGKPVIVSDTDKKK